MKLFLITISLFINGVFFQENNFNDFDYRLTRIADEFQKEIMDKDECENLKLDAGSLVGEIEDELKAMTDTENECKELKELKKEAQALEGYIGSVGDCGNYILSNENLDLANRRVNSQIIKIESNKLCVDVISVSIGKYVSYLAQNNTTNNYSIAYKWKTPDGLSSGNGTMGLPAKSVRHIFDNRDKPNQKRILVFEIKCKPY
jgi:hypothetical protein